MVRVNQPSRKQDRDRLRGDRPTGSAVQFCSCFNFLQKCLLLLYQCTPPTSVADENIQFEESQDRNCVKNLKRWNNNKKNFKKEELFSIFLTFGFWGGSISRADSRTGTGWGETDRQAAQCSFAPVSIVCRNVYCFYISVPLLQDPDPQHCCRGRGEVSSTLGGGGVD